MKVFPAIVSVPDRAAPFVEATLKATVPFPLPLPPDVIEIHDTLLFALQPQPDGAVTATDPEPPDEATDCESGEIANAHPLPCETVTVCPAMVSVPERAGPSAAATLRVTVPAPLPPLPEAIVIHDALLEALQPQPLLVFTFTV